MDSTLYIALSHQEAIQRRLDVIANNIANMNTTAYQRESVMFQEYLTNLDGVDSTIGQGVAFLQDVGVSHDFREGGHFSTGNDLDLAISGPAFLTVETPQGEIRYTRNGHFKLNEEGELATESGALVLDDSGDPIFFGPQDVEITIATDGTISSRAGRIARLALVEFDDRQSLTRIGNSLYKTDATAIESENGAILQGMLEASNVNAIEEITNLINVSRSYQSVAKLLNDYQDLRTNSISRLGRVSA